MMSSLHVCNGFVRPADESMLTWDIRTSGHSENIMAFAVHSLRRHNNADSEIKILIRCKLLTCRMFAYCKWFVKQRFASHIMIL